MKTGLIPPGLGLAPALGAALAGAALACSGPPPLPLRLVCETPQAAVGEPVRFRVVAPTIGDAADAEALADPLAALAGRPLPGTHDRKVHLDGAAAPELGAAYSVSALGPSPSMLLQWGGFEAETPADPARRRGYRLELHGDPVGLPPPPGWPGEWDPAAERWYAPPGRIDDDAALTRLIHRGMGARFGEETEPWIKLERDPEGRPHKLHIWVVLGAGFDDPSRLWMRLEPANPESVRVRWRFGDGGESVELAAAPDLLGRLRATHRFSAPAPTGGYLARADLELDWLYGAWATGGEPWEWRVEVHYLGAIDLAALGAARTAEVSREITRHVEDVRGRLRCLPGDAASPGLGDAPPCTYPETTRPDDYLDSSGDAISALLRRVLPSDLADRAASLPMVGEPREVALRYRFSGAFPYHSAPEGGPPEVRAAWGDLGGVAVDVRASGE